MITQENRYENDPIRSTLIEDIPFATQSNDTKKLITNLHKSGIFYVGDLDDYVIAPDKRGLFLTNKKGDLDKSSKITGVGIKGIHILEEALKELNYTINWHANDNTSNLKSHHSDGKKHTLSLESEAQPNKHFVTSDFELAARPTFSKRGITATYSVPTALSAFIKAGYFDAEPGYAFGGDTEIIKDRTGAEEVEVSILGEESPSTITLTFDEGADWSTIINGDIPEKLADAANNIFTRTRENKRLELLRKYSDLEQEVAATEQIFGPFNLTK